MTSDKMTSWGMKVIRFSPLEMLLLGILVFLGYTYAGFGKEFTLAAFAVGVVLSPIALGLYKGGKGAFTPFLLSFLAVILVFLVVTRLAKLESGQGPVVGGLYAGICLLFGTSILFTLLRGRLLRYLQGSDQKRS
ncbi:MAG: hypothetical protein QME66_02515 [Candidatus Eisenbacteria bacterium]|nr:hypothetical protein [Candidatus Eisenbacteria bacterium]